MSLWTVDVDPPAGSELRKLDEGPKRDALELLEDLADNPYGVFAHELEGYRNTWSARFYFDQYRMVYQISGLENEFWWFESGHAKLFIRA